MADIQALALQARMSALQARLEALKWANIQDSNGTAYTPDHFFVVETELLEVAAAFWHLDGGQQPDGAKR